MHLICSLPKDRTQAGMLELYHCNSKLGAWPCLGKADNAMAAAKGNPTRNPLKPFGDTPTGSWKVRKGQAQADTATFGIHPVLLLWPISGDAYAAYSPANRRTGIWLHGGSLGPAGNLRPTYGCLRVSDQTMADLHRFAGRLGPIETLEVKET